MQISEGAKTHRAALLVAGALLAAACEADPADEAAPADPEGVDPDVTVEDADPDAEGPAPDAEGPAPDGFGPPADEIGAPIAIEPVVLEGEDAVVALTGVTAYGDGMELLVTVRWDPDGEGRSPQDEPGGPMDLHGVEDPPASEEELPDDLLRVEVIHPDGAVASSADELLATLAGEEPQEPVLHPHTGMGDQVSWDQQVWLRPLPEEGEGPLEFAVEWPAQGLDEQVALDVDGDDVTDAADRVVRLWDGPDDTAG